MKTTVSLPPVITQRFDSMLLSYPTPDLRDSCKTIGIMLKEVEKLWKRIENNPAKKLRCEKLKQEIMELYERAKVKEKERQGQKNHKTQEFGYFIGLPKENDRDVYWRLRYGRKAGRF